MSSNHRLTSISAVLDDFSASQYFSADETIPALVDRLALLIILVTAAFLRFYALGSESFSYDEGIMIEATGSGWKEVVANISRGRPPVIVIVGYIWVTIFGESEFAVRTLPAVAGILSVAALYFVGRLLTDRRTALIAAAILSISAFHVFHSQDFRYYSLLTLNSLLCYLFFVRLFGNGQNSADPVQNTYRAHRFWLNWSLYVAFGVLVYYTHYQGIFLLIAQGIYFLLRWPSASWVARRRWLWSQVTIGFLLLPGLYKIYTDFVGGSAQGDFQGSIGVMGNLGPLTDPPLYLPFHTILIKFHFISVESLGKWPFWLLAVLLVLIGLGVQQNRRFALHRRGAGFSQASRFPDLAVGKDQLLLIILWALCPVFLPFILSKLVGPIYLPRYTIGALPAVSLLIALTIVALRRWIPTWATLGALISLVVPALIFLHAVDSKGQWRLAATYVQQESTNDAPFTFVSINNETADRIQKLFRRYLQENNHSFAPSLPLDSKADCLINAGLTPIDNLPLQLNNCFDGHSHMWLVTRGAKPGAQQLVEAALLDNIPANWQLIDEERFSGIVLYRYALSATASNARTQE